MDTAARQVLDSAAFRRLVAKRWKISVGLSLLLFALYYGYILLIAINKPFLAHRIGETATLGLPVGAAVIIGSWVLTGVYVVWANRRYDVEVERLRSLLRDPHL